MTCSGASICEVIENNYTCFLSILLRLFAFEADMIVTFPEMWWGRQEGGYMTFYDLDWVPGLICLSTSMEETFRTILKVKNPACALAS